VGLLLSCDDGRDFLVWCVSPLNEVCRPSGEPPGEPFCDRETDDTQRRTITGRNSVAGTKLVGLTAAHDKMIDGMLGGLENGLMLYDCENGETALLPQRLSVKLGYLVIELTCRVDTRSHQPH
jgi:hypothetical protein